MTKVNPQELVAYQIITSPVLSSFHRPAISMMNTLRKRIAQGKPLTEALQQNMFQKMMLLPLLSPFGAILSVVFKIYFIIPWLAYNFIAALLDTSGKSVPLLQSSSRGNTQEILSPYETELSDKIKAKIDQELFETSIRILVVSPESNRIPSRLQGLVATFGQLSASNQGLTTKDSGLFSNTMKHELERFKSRQLSPNSPFNPNPILSTSELSDLYHFPFTDTTKTEDMVKVHSMDLPAPLTLKNNDQLDVVFGENTYSGARTPIGLTDEDRSRHLYMIGQTGSGKSTVMFQMATGDIQKGRGLVLIDPHGDLAEDLLATVPDSRINDVIYFNPFDIKHPIGINLLELSKTSDEDELEQEKELVTESVISIFRRIFMADDQSSAHRIEYILRNTIYTAFTVPDCTIFTVYDLLNNPEFAKTVITKLTDENLKNFWKNEFGHAGNFQIVKMISGVTAKIGRFLFSPTAKRIFEQPKSTINFDSILKKQQILICNLSEGKISEDVSQVLGTTIIAKIKQAVDRRSRLKSSERTPFYLFVDEFQNYATSSFTKLLSGGRKFGLRVAVAEQSTSQQADHDITNVILANSGTVICFKTANPIDEELMLLQFAPYVKPGEIDNLPRYHFYMKLSATTPEEPFSGKTLPIVIQDREERIDIVAEASRKNYATTYVRQVKTVEPPKTRKKTVTKEANIVAEPKKKKLLA